MRNNVGEPPDRRIRRRTLMSPFQFTSIVLALVWLSGWPAPQPPKLGTQTWHE